MLNPNPCGGCILEKVVYLLRTMPQPLIHFIPCYSSKEVERLFELWVDGSLDGVQSCGKPAIGVEGCDIRARGITPQTLIHQICSTDMQRVVKSMINAGEPYATYAEFLGWHFVNKVPLQNLAAIYDLPDCATAVATLIRAQDDFVKRLLARNR